MLMMMRADKGYTPNEKCSLEEMVACALAEDTDACLAACTGNEEETPTGNGFVTVKGKAASTQDVAKNAVNKNVWTMTLKAGEYDTTVSSVVIGHSGLGDATNVSVQLFQNGVAVTSQKTISKSSQQVTLKLSPAIVMKANSSMTFDVVASLSGESNETHNFSVEAVNVANGKAEGTPVSLWTLKTTSYTAGTVTATLTSTASLKAGDTDKTIYTVKLTPSKKGTINSVTITKQAWNEDFDELVNNVKAYYNDEVIGNVKVTDEKIVISNLKIERNAGQSATIDLRWDCIYVWASVVTTWAIELNDVIAVESNTDENMWNAASANAAFTVAGADLKLTNKTTKEQTVVPGSSDVELLNVEITSKSELEVVDYTVTLTQGTGTLNTWNFVDGIITVYVDGEDYEMDATTFTWTKKESFTISSNSPVRIRAVANFTEDATADTYKMSVTLTNAKTTDGNNTISLWKTVAWHTTKLQAATATVKAATKSAPVTDSLFENKEQEVLRFAIKAASDKTTVKTLELTESAISDKTLLPDLLNWKLRLVNVENDEEIDATFEDVTAAWVIAIKDMNLEIAKDATINVKLMANIWDIDAVMGNSLLLTVTNGTFKTATTSSTWVTLSPAAGVAGKMYTFRATAPEITLAKASDNMFALNIKNLNDTWIAYSGLTYRVRTDVANVDFVWSVCLVDDVNIISCEDAAALWTWSFGSWTVSTATWDLAENEDVTYYILIDGTSIEPSVLRAEISELRYNGAKERYSVSRLLNE